MNLHGPRADSAVVQEPAGIVQRPLTHHLDVLILWRDAAFLGKATWLVASHGSAAKRVVTKAGRGCRSAPLWERSATLLITIYLS